MVWNSGVLGVHSNDLPLMREALNLCDQLWSQDLITKPAGERVHTLEQFAAGVLLSRSRLSETSDVVFHYWRSYLREPFAKKLEEIVLELKNVSLPEHVDHIYKLRPRETVKNTVKGFVRTCLRRMGRRVRGIRTST